jgi:hypothetical protein
MLVVASTHRHHRTRRLVALLFITLLALRQLLFLKKGQIKTNLFSMKQFKQKIKNERNFNYKNKNSQFLGRRKKKRRSIFVLVLLLL